MKTVLSAVVFLMVAVLPVRAVVWPKAPCTITISAHVPRADHLPASMGRAVRPGDVVRVQPVEKVSPALVGFVLAMRDEVHEQVVVHRCIAVSRAANGAWRIVTLGDANLAADLPWDEAQLIGVLDLPRRLPGGRKS